MPTSRKVWAGVVVLAVAGCQPMGGTYVTGLEGQPVPAYNAYGSYPSPASQPPQHIMQQQAMAAPSYETVEPAAGTVPNTSRLQGDIAQLGDRLQRVEKAMLRLDRRMQLVERNELNRMGGETPAGLTSLTPQEETLAMQNMNIGPQYGNGFRAVSSEGAITSSLQAANTGVASVGAAAPRLAGLPSLADRGAAASTSSREADLAVWTVIYENGKTWPDRNQLPFSRDVVEALRNGSGVTVFARGKHPQAVEFRERVKALSRYLGKVASLESVPISAIPAPHLGDDTIEIFATH
ncbi:MAG: hypothetical protein H6922_05620 [Pseudomonadaceae bacterium]|nr:hypothetical protein [Pseudomonadaceae bacterium]